MPHRGKVIAGFAVVFCAILFGVIPRMEFQFFPQGSSPGFSIKVTMPPGTPIEQTEANVNAIQGQLFGLMNDDLIAVTSRVGHQDAQSFAREYGSSENEGIVSVHLYPGSKSRNSAEWIEVVRAGLRVPSQAEIRFAVTLDGPPGLEPVSIYVLANDHVVRRQTGLVLAQFLAGIEGVVDISIDEKPGMRQIDLNPDPERMARKGLNAEDLGRTLKAAYYGLVASEIRDLDETTGIRVAFEPSARRSLDALLETPIRNSRGELVLLRDVVDPIETPALAKIQHRNGRRSVLITAGLSPNGGQTGTTVAERVEQEFLPLFAARSDVEIEIAGEVVQAREAVSDLAFVGVAVLFGIGAVIAIMLGSFLEAFFVIAVVPFAAVFVALTFWVHGMNFSLLPLIGTIGLSGVVVNASIVMVDSVHQAIHHLKIGASEEERTEVVIEAFVSRLRPVLVTSLSTLGGVLPTAYGFGGWDAVMSPMSLALGWGLALSSIVTLFLVPSLYIAASDINRKIADIRGQALTPLNVAEDAAA